MKKLFLSAAMLFALAATAQTEQTPTNPTTPVTAEVTPADEQDKEYKKIAQAEIAPDVLKPAVAKYKGYALVEALMATDGSEYKLVLTKDGKDIAAFFKSNGEFIKEETV